MNEEKSVLRYVLTRVPGLLGAASLLPSFIKRLRARPADTSPAEGFDAEEIYRKLRQCEDITVLDVRLAKDLDGPLGRIEGSIFIPLEELPQRLGELSSRRDHPIFTVCRAEKRSGQAAAILRDAGFSRSQFLPGGMEGWIKKGLPVAKKAFGADGERP